MNIPPKCEDLYLKIAELERREAALKEDLASEKIISKTMLGQKEAFMKLSDERRFELKECKAREAALREELDKVCGDEWRKDKRQIIDLQQRLTVAEQRLGDAYEWGYGDGQNSPNGYSDKEDRDKCVADLLKPAEKGEGS